MKLSMDYEEQTTNYAATVVRFQKSHDGRSVMMAIISQHAGKSVWEGYIKDATDYMIQ